MALRKSIPTRPLWTGEQHNVAGLVTGQAGDLRFSPGPRRLLVGALDMSGMAAAVGVTRAPESGGPKHQLITNNRWKKSPTRDISYHYISLHLNEL